MISLKKKRSPTFDKSVASCVSLMEEWDYKLNECSPEQVFKSGKTEVWWKCKKCNESYQLTPNKKERMICPHCKQKQILYNSLFYKRPDLALQWHDTKNDKTPFDYTVKSNKEVWWKCNDCNYEWEAHINNRSRNETNICPSCNGRVLTEENSLAYKFPDIASQWHPTLNGDLTPRDVFAVSGLIYWWKCEICGHEWETSIANRTSGRKCSKCNNMNSTSFGEQAIFYYIKQVFKDAINQYHLTTGKQDMEFDIYIPSHKIAIEFDGFWYHSKNNRKKHDKLKNSFAINNGITLFRLREEKLNDLKGSINILNCKPDRRNLDTKLQELFLIISNSVNSIGAVDSRELQNLDIDTNRDSTEIYSNINKIKTDNSFLKDYPYLEKYWSDKNGELNPHILSYGSQIPVWWKCPDCKEGWQLSVKNMCNRKKYKLCNKCHEENNLHLLAKLPELAKQWHPTKNGELTPKDVKPNSKTYVYWLDEHGVESYTMVKSKVDLYKLKFKKKKENV